ncbi:hypothetical protein THAOC_15064 [Thalassiosira oceanica]|uniref:CRAL-TRIO domain-containing protein n=1 Tax=Thalassiosira oceanica TaxID=159749 RepID=K0SGZ1_THAOC|nr:hypothetical protein THAOC_15064 [Thalassiosira oceanica]|eukprot:EJK64224.1 hypothetical protein THAOC_15064 [Thalassiosira oceanica]
MPPSGTDGFRSGGLMSRNPSLFPCAYCTNEPCHNLALLIHSSPGALGYCDIVTVGMAKKKKAKKNRRKGGSKLAVENSNEKMHDADDIIDAPETKRKSAGRTADEHDGSSLTSDEAVQGESRGHAECMVSSPHTLQNAIVEEFKGTAESSIELAATESQPDAGEGESECVETASAVTEEVAMKPVFDAGLIELPEDVSGHPVLETSDAIEGEKGQQVITDAEHVQDLNVTCDDEMKDVTTEKAVTEIAENTEKNQFSEESQEEEEELAEEVTEVHNTSDLVCETSCTVEIEQVQSRPRDGDVDDKEEDQGPVDEPQDGGVDDKEEEQGPVDERGDITDDNEESEEQAGAAQTENVAENLTAGSIKDNGIIEVIGSSDENQAGAEVDRDFSMTSSHDEFVAPKQKTSFGSQFSRDLSDVDLESESGKDVVRRFSSKDDILPLNCDPSTDIDAFRFLTNALRQNLGEDANGFTELELSQFTRWKPDVKAASGRFREYLKFRRENAYLYEKPLLVSENPHLVITLRTGFILAPENLITFDGSAVMIIRAAKCDPSQPECGEEEVSRAVFFTIHSILGRKSLDPVKGLTIILDLGGVTRKNIAKRIPSMLSKASGCLPIRIRSILVVSQPWWFPNHQKLLSQKIRLRVKHLKKKCDLSEYIDQSKLLIEDGGNASFDLKSELSNIILHEVDLKYEHDECPPAAETE